MATGTPAPKKWWIIHVAAGVAAGMKVIALDRATSIPQHFEGETWRVRDLSELDVEKEFGA